MASLISLNYLFLVFETKFLTRSVLYSEFCWLLMGLERGGRNATYLSVKQWLTVGQIKRTDQTRRPISQYTDKIGPTKHHLELTVDFFTFL